MEIDTNTKTVRLSFKEFSDLLNQNTRNIKKDNNNRKKYRRNKRVEKGCKKWSRIETLKLVELDKKGWSYKKIGKVLGRSKIAIGSRLHLIRNGRMDVKIEG